MSNTNNNGRRIITFLFVVSASEQQELRLAVEILQAREEEMLRTAERLGVTRDNWHGSFLFRQYRRRIQASSHTFDCSGKSWLMADHGATISWIRQYYQTGLLQIPALAHGYSVLAALEYFAILYGPDQCHFADYNVYERVQLWARYLSHRDVLTEHVKQHTTGVDQQEQEQQQQQQTGSKATTTTTTTVHFGVAPTHQEGMDLGTTNQTRITPLGGAEYASVAYSLFSPKTNDDQDETLQELREDFCHHLVCELQPEPSTAVFVIQPVTLHSSPTSKKVVVNRAVLTIVIRRPDLDNPGGCPVPEQKKKLIFMLPDELDVPIDQRGGGGGALMGQTTPADENTVISGLTGPFHTDRTDHVKDIFEHEEAKRHEWVQTALMNRGITERMERLLHPEDQHHHHHKSARSSSSANPWDWFTGLGVCEMSRTVAERVGSYMSEKSSRSATGAAHRDNVVVVVTTATKNNNNKLNHSNKSKNLTKPVPLPTASPVSPRTSSRVKDRLNELCLTELENRPKFDNNCDSSKESPRGVADYHPEQSMQDQDQQLQQKQLSPPKRIPAAIEDPTTATHLSQPDVNPALVVVAPSKMTSSSTAAVPVVISSNNNNTIKKKGLLGLFRRHKNKQAN